MKLEKLKAKKSLGQNFLHDDAVVKRIVESAKLSEQDSVIEVGPGEGVLTELLARVCKKVIAIELDDRLVPILQEKFKNVPNVEIIHGDIMKINLPELIERQALVAQGYRVVANLPYYITSPIIRLFLETKHPAKEMFFMVQKEVAERIAAKGGAMSILAVSVQYYARVQFLFTVFKESFEPKPKVDSAIIRINRFKNQELGVTNDKAETKQFFRIVKAGFSAKRKTLVNNLSNGLQLDKGLIEDKLVLMGFTKNTRAQELSVTDWHKLQNSLG